ncbi:MAG: MFS transporter [Alphaproteobacteria bacterium]|nr:MFS transporter [Alphaproteobacteria bacterium]
MSAIAARLEALPPTHGFWRRVALISLGGFFEFYDLFLAAYVVPGLTAEHILVKDSYFAGPAGFVAAFFAGLWLGTALFGFVADRLGRRAIFTFSLVWYAAAAIGMATQSDAVGLALFRFLGGIGIGVELVTIDTYIAELAPRAVRGRAFAFANVIQFGAIPLAAFLAWLLVPLSPLSVSGWRWVILIGAAGAVVVWFARRGVPESPRWLLAHGRDAEAQTIIACWEEEARHEDRPLHDVVPAPPQERRGSLTELWRPPYRGRALMLIVFNLFQACGYYGFASWVPTLLISQGIAVTTSLGYTFIIAIAAPFGPLAGLFFTERVERKWIIAAAGLAIAAVGLIFALQRSVGAILACGVALTLANNILSFAYHGYQPELFPTRMRAAAVGFVYSFSRLATVGSSFIIAALLARFGAPGVFVFIAGCMGVVALVIGAFGPSTRGRALEEISR